MAKTNDELEDEIKSLKVEISSLRAYVAEYEKSKTKFNFGEIESAIKNPVKFLEEAITGYGNLVIKTIGDINTAATEAAAKFGTGLKNYESISQEIAKVLPDLTKLGFDASEIGKMQKQFTEKIHTNVVLSADALKNIGTLDTLGANGASIAANFRDSAQSVSGMIDELEVAGQVAGDYGVNASKIFADIEKTMQTTNQYRFENGVEGISRMAAQTAIMGISFEKVVNFADSVTNPQGAIDAVAAFQRLGVTVSGLQDPFKLMYMAQSDMEGLTEEIGKSVSNLGTFNRETGKLEIPPSARMQLKEMGDILKLGPDEMNKLVSQQAKFNAMAGDFEGLGVSEEDRMMISNLAEFNKETQQFEVKVGGETKAVTSLSDEDIKILQQRPESLEDAAFQQLSVMETISNQVESIKQGGVSMLTATKTQFDTEKAARAGVQVAGDTITDAFKAANIRKEIDIFAKDLNFSFSKLLNAFSGTDTLENAIESFTKLSEQSNASVGETMDRFKASYLTSISNASSKIDSIMGDDNIYKPLKDSLSTGFNSLGEYINKFFKNFGLNVEVPIGIKSPEVGLNQAAQVQAAENQVQSVGVTGSQATPSIEVPTEDFVIRTLPEDTIKVVGGTNLPPGGADITNILNNQTNNTQALTSIQPVLNRDLANLETPRTAETNRIEEKELRVKFDPFIVKLEGDGKSIEMALQDNVVRDKIIDMVGKAMTSDYNTMGRPILGNRA